MVFEKLKEIFGRVMPQCDPSTITMDSVLTTDLGVDSLNMMLLAITVEDEFKIRFSSDAKLETVKDIVDYVEANAKQRSLMSEVKTGLVLEGGAMRGIFSAGVLDYMLKKDIY